VDLNSPEESVLSKLHISEDRFIVGDIFSEEVETRIEKHAPFNVILSDAAPNTTGNRTVDTGRSFTLAQKVVDYAQTMLSPGGNLVVKIFQGGDEQELYKTMKHLFDSVKAYKPKASRAPSMEIYYIGMGKKG
jgi:23S rRNA (uridine2552-2'-O)-methyltransferase